MKTLQFTGIIIILTLLLGCVPEAKMYEATYTINNSTNNEVILRVFKLFENGNYNDYTLFTDDSFYGENVEGTNFDYFNDLNNSEPSVSYSSDSIYVVFDNERILKYVFSGDSNGNSVFSQPLNRNILRGGNYTNISNDIYEFVLTEEDYNNAIPCAGDCLD